MRHMHRNLLEKSRLMNLKIPRLFLPQDSRQFIYLLETPFLSLFLVVVEVAEVVAAADFLLRETGSIQFEEEETDWSGRPFRTRNNTTIQNPDWKPETRSQ